MANQTRAQPADGSTRLIHRLTYRQQNHANFPVRGYKEHDNTNNDLELAFSNQIDRFNLVIDRVEMLGPCAPYP